MMFFLRVCDSAVLGGDLHEVINTRFLYHVLWHGEKSRGLEFKARGGIQMIRTDTEHGERTDRGPTGVGALARDGLNL